VSEPVKAKPLRTRRADRTRLTRARIVAAAARLFFEHGYVAATIEAIATEADVAVETVYARFRNKRALLIAVVEDAVTQDGTVPLEERPELAALAAESDHAAQLQQAARLSRSMLERISPVYALLKDAARTDGTLRDAVAEQIAMRRGFQRRLVELLQRGRGLRPGLTLAAAAETYAALANPELFLLLLDGHGWTAARYERWLADTLERLLFQS
jgi:AcrR family transcriptional regulator